MQRIRYRVFAAVALAALAVSAVVSPAFATSGSIQATVRSIVVQDTAVGNMFFTLNSTASIGNCNKQGSNVMFLIPDNERGKQMLAVLNAAYLSGRTVSAFLDDRGMGPNYCTAGWVAAP